jgi:hypothetical protein
MSSTTTTDQTTSATRVACAAPALGMGPGVVLGQNPLSLGGEIPPAARAELPEGASPELPPPNDAGSVA